MDKIKYIVEKDILDKDSRIEIILEACDLVFFDNIDVTSVINSLSDKWKIYQDDVIRLMPDVILDKLNCTLCN